MKRRDFLTAAAAVSIPGAAIAAPPVMPEIEDKWDPTPEIGYVRQQSPTRLTLQQKWVNTRTGSIEWRHFPDVTETVLGKKPT